MVVDGLWWDLVGLRVAALRWDSSGKVRIGDERGSGILGKLYHEVWKMQTCDRHAALGRLLFVLIGGARESFFFGAGEPSFSENAAQPFGATTLRFRTCARAPADN